jgi:effector-binding domain-containing protein
MDYQVERIELAPQSAAVVRASVTFDGVAAFLGGAFGEVMGLLGSQGVAPTGPPFAMFHMHEDGLDIEAGFPFEAEVRPVGRVEQTELPGGPAVVVLHRGAYSEVSAAYAAAEGWLAQNGWEATGRAWEAYLDGPEVAEPRTIVHVPCRPV